MSTEGICITYIQSWAACSAPGWHCLGCCHREQWEFRLLLPLLSFLVTGMTAAPKALSAPRSLRKGKSLETQCDHFPEGSQVLGIYITLPSDQVKESSSELTTNNEVVLLSLTIINLSVNKPLPSECAASFKFPLWILSSAIFFSLLNLHDLPPSTNSKWRGRKGG